VRQNAQFKASGCGLACLEISSGKEAAALREHENPFRLNACELVQQFYCIAHLAPTVRRLRKSSKLRLR
jgi:hypothetical protein